MQLRRAIGWTVAFLALGTVLSVALYLGLDGLVPAAGNQLVAVLLQGAAMLLAFGAVTWIVGFRGARLSPTAMGYAAPAEGIRGFGAGFLLGVLPAALAMGLAVVAGEARWLLDGGTVLEWAGAAAMTGGVLLPAALAEEVIFRGVPLIVLAMAVGRTRAVAGLAVLFAGAHLLNPNATALGFVNIALAGGFLSACFYLPGGLWTATGAHLGWNLALAALAAPVSGVPLTMPLLDYDPGGPVWLTGGSFGPEGGALATIIFLSATWWVVRRIRQGSTA